MAIEISEPRFSEQPFLEQKNFRILSQVGFGRNNVYKCLDLVTRKLVAIKSIVKEDMHGKSDQLTEFDLLMALRHPNIVTYINSFEDDRKIFLVTEYCEDKIERFSRTEQPVPLGEDEVRLIGRQILSGLSYLHANHIVHRDIKPGNILKTGAGFVRIADFGDAKIIKKPLEKAKFGIGDLYGTPQFMAPECLHKAEVGSSADIWSFGCVMLFLLTAKPPWHASDNQFNVLFKLGSSKDLPANIDTLPLSESCKEVLRSTIQRCPDSRPTALELLTREFFASARNSII